MTAIPAPRPHRWDEIRSTPTSVTRSFLEEFNQGIGVGFQPLPEGGTRRMNEVTIYSLRDLVALPDLIEIPPIGSRQRDEDERAVMARARELIIQEDGRLREALFELEQELRDPGAERATRIASEIAREYARALVSHVEQCWATAVLR